MKRALLVLALTALLVMAAHSMALGAVHHATADVESYHAYFNTVTTDTWFYIDGESPKLLFKGSIEADNHNVAAMYFKNDQTFVQADFDDSTNVAGSYLFNNNIFAGFDYWTNSDSYLLLSFGYLFNLNDQNYIALSVDYIAESPSGYWGHDAMNFDLDFKFFGEKYYFFGQLYFYENDDDWHYLALNYQFSETFVGGLFVEMEGSDADLGGGFTWSPASWIVDMYFVERDSYSYIKTSGMYQASDKLGIGIEYRKYTDEDDNRMIAKAKYDFASGQLRAMYGFGNDTYDSYFALAYEMKLK